MCQAKLTLFHVTHHPTFAGQKMLFAMLERDTQQTQGRRMRKLLPWLSILAVLIAIGGAVALWAGQRQAQMVERIAELTPDQRPDNAKDRALLAKRMAAAKQQPDDPLKWNSLGNMLFSLEAFAQAEKVYRKSLELDGSQSTVWSLMGEAQVRQGTEKDPVSVTAMFAFNQALRLDPNDLRAHFYVSLADYNNGRRSKAISRMRYVLEASEPDTMARIAAEQTLKEWNAAGIAAEKKN